MSVIFDFIYDVFTSAFIRIKRLQPVQTGKLSENVFAVKTGSVNFYVYRNNLDYVLVDSGFGKSIIKRELNDLGIDPNDISHLFLTHSDFDHVGGKSIFPNAKIWISRDEEQMITRTTARKYRFIYNSRINMAYSLLKDNDEIIVGSIRIRAIETPGHTPGSMSYLIDNKVLFVGDALKLIHGKAYPIGRFFSMDKETQEESIRKLARLGNIQLVLTAHRGYAENFNNAMEPWR